MKIIQTQQTTTLPSYVVVAIPGDRYTKIAINEELSRFKGAIPADDLGLLESKISDVVYFSTLLMLRNGDASKRDRYKAMNYPILELRNGEYCPIAPTIGEYRDYFQRPARVRKLSDYIGEFLQGLRRKLRQR